MHAAYAMALLPGEVSPPPELPAGPAAVELVL
jgi:hypothetical protein